MYPPLEELKLKELSNANLLAQHTVRHGRETTKG